MWIIWQSKFGYMGHYTNCNNCYCNGDFDCWNYFVLFPKLVELWLSFLEKIYRKGQNTALSKKKIKKAFFMRPFELDLIWIQKNSYSSKSTIRIFDIKIQLTYRFQKKWNITFVQSVNSSRILCSSVCLRTEFWWHLVC